MPNAGGVPTRIAAVQGSLRGGSGHLPNGGDFVYSAGSRGDDADTLDICRCRAAAMKGERLAYEPAGFIYEPAGFTYEPD